MKTIFTAIACMLYIGASAQDKIDLSKEPVETSPMSAIKKSNAELLKESKNNTAPIIIQEDELSDRYKANLGSNSGSGVSTTTSPQSNQQNNTGNFNFNTAPTNTIQTNQYNQNLGNGVKSQSTIKIDETGKVRSSSSSIKLGK
ncbi:MAG: hypothetical protein H6551_06175 [Chitinophagales bacterium]|nr:hypothetical protein [Chitinophagaceae bacterium]MCB9064715.1 hypothetical protein [Chitinophagales bacterium]